MPLVIKTKPHGAEVAQMAKKHLAHLTGLKPDTVIRIHHNEDGWHVAVVMVELKTVTATRDVLAVYEVTIDDDGEITSYQRTQRYHRGEINNNHQ